MTSKYTVESLSQGRIVIEADTYYLGETFVTFYGNGEGRHVFHRDDIRYFFKENEQ